MRLPSTRATGPGVNCLEFHCELQVCVSAARCLCQGTVLIGVDPPSSNGPVQQGGVSPARKTPHVFILVLVLCILRFYRLKSIQISNLGSATHLCFKFFRPPLVHVLLRPRTVSCQFYGLPHKLRVLSVQLYDACPLSG